MVVVFGTKQTWQWNTPCFSGELVIIAKRRIFSTKKLGQTTKPPAKPEKRG
jgi:hypothetical protein